MKDEIERNDGMASGECERVAGWLKRLKRAPRSGNGPPDLSLSETAADQDGQASGEPMQCREEEGKRGWMRERTERWAEWSGADQTRAQHSTGFFLTRNNAVPVPSRISN